MMQLMRLGKDENTFEKRDMVARNNKAEGLYECHLSAAV